MYKKSAMPLGLTMGGKWQGITRPMHVLKERSSYSTPQPVESTPSNNQCKIVDVRGAHVASFVLGEQEYICLPQAFDLFLKNMVGGLHTVYTKLKRLNVTPVVCNVEQVRILRSLGAIQPGVNRCKLITREDFEILYKDCTQASRPGRPPKRCPIPASSDTSSLQFPGIGTMVAQGILGASDQMTLHKRRKLHQDSENPQQHLAGRLSEFPQTDESIFSTNDMPKLPGLGLEANTGQLYLQIQQALRQQYQEVMKRRLATNSTNLNPNLASLMMVSQTYFLKNRFPQHMLDHLTQFTQGVRTTGSLTGVTTADDAADGSGEVIQEQAKTASQAEEGAQSKLRGSSIQTIAGQAKRDAPASQNTPNNENTFLIDSLNDNEPNNVSTRYADEPASPRHGNMMQCSSNSSVIMEQQSALSVPLEFDDDSTMTESIENHCNNLIAGLQIRHKPRRQFVDTSQYLNDREISPKRDDSAITQLTDEHTSSMQILLTNIQGLVKIAAENANLQEKDNSFEIAELKSQMSMERHQRENVERRLRRSKKVRAMTQLSLDKEKIKRMALQEELCEISENSTDEERKNTKWRRRQRKPKHEDADVANANHMDISSVAADTKRLIEASIDMPTEDRLSPEASLTEESDLELITSRDDNNNSTGNNNSNNRNNDVGGNHSVTSFRPSGLGTSFKNTCSPESGASSNSANGEIPA